MILNQLFMYPPLSVQVVIESIFSIEKIVSK